MLQPPHTQAPGIQGSWHLTNCSTYSIQHTYSTLQVLEFLRSRTDLRGQRWSPVSTCTQHVTHTSHVSCGDKAVVTGHQESPEAASQGMSPVLTLPPHAQLSSAWNALCWFAHSLSAVLLVICSSQPGSVRTDLSAHFTPFMFKIAAVFSSLTFNWRQNVPVMRIFITSTLLPLGQGSQENFLMSAETN